MVGKRLIFGILVIILLLVGCAQPSPETPTPPSIPMTLYQGTEHGFSIEYPEGWTESTQGAGTQFSFDFQDPEGHLTASVYLQYECRDIIPADFISEGKAYMESMPQYRLISERDLPVGEGISGYEIVASGDAEKEVRRIAREEGLEIGLVLVSDIVENQLNGRMK